MFPLELTNVLCRLGRDSACRVLAEIDGGGLVDEVRGAIQRHCDHPDPWHIPAVLAVLCVTIVFAWLFVKRLLESVTHHPYLGWLQAGIAGLLIAAGSCGAMAAAHFTRGIYWESLLNLKDSTSSTSVSPAILLMGEMIVIALVANVFIDRKLRLGRFLATLIVLPFAVVGQAILLAIACFLGSVSGAITTAVSSCLLGPLGPVVGFVVGTAIALRSFATLDWDSLGSGGSGAYQASSSSWSTPSCHPSPGSSSTSSYSSSPSCSSGLSYGGSTEHVSGWTFQRYAEGQVTQDRK